MSEEADLEAQVADAEAELPEAEVRQEQDVDLSEPEIKQEQEVELPEAEVKQEQEVELPEVEVKQESEETEIPVKQEQQAEEPVGEHKKDITLEPAGHHSEPEVTLTASKSVEKEASDNPVGNLSRGTTSGTSDVSGITDAGLAEVRVGVSTESTNHDLPMVPKSSRQSYDGPGHHQHKEARGPEINEALYQLAEADSKEAHILETKAEHSEEVLPQVVQSKPQKTYSYRAREYDEKKIVAAMKVAPPKHQFMGYVFSSQTPRPHGIANFFLPSVPQPAPRKHIAVRGAPVPPEVLFTSMRTAPAGLMPLSAVKITWCSSPRHTVYSLPDLYAYLTRFGPIEAIYQRCPNSVLAIFCDLTSARACVKDPQLGSPWDRLVASWWEPRMHNQGYQARHIREEEHSNMLDIEGPVLREERPSDVMSITT